MSDLNREQTGPRRRIVLLALLGVALLGSAWAAYAKSAGCGSCGGADPGGSALAVLGIFWYAGILGVALLSGPSARETLPPIVARGALLAGGLHGVLLVYLLAHGIACAPCLITGFSAILAAGIVLSLQPEIQGQALALLPMGALGANLWLVFVWMAGLSPITPPLPGVEVSIQEDLDGSKVGREARVNMVIFYRPDCPYCVELDEKVMPQIRKDFGASLSVRYISAGSMPGLQNIPTPTIVLSGPEGQGRLTIPGLPETSILRREISNVLEATRHGL